VDSGGLKSLDFRGGRSPNQGGKGKSMVSGRNLKFSDHSKRRLCIWEMRAQVQSRNREEKWGKKQGHERLVIS